MPSPSDQATINAAVIAGVFLLIGTVLGAVITAFFNARSQGRQIAADKEREVRQRYIPDRIEELKKLRIWFSEGVELVARKVNQKASTEEFQQRCVNWIIEYDRLLTYVNTMYSTVMVRLPLKASLKGLAKDSSGSATIMDHRLAAVLLRYFRALSNPLTNGWDVLDDQQKSEYYFAKDYIQGAAIKKREELIKQTATIKERS